MFTVPRSIQRVSSVLARGPASIPASYPILTRSIASSSRSNLSSTSSSARPRIGAKTVSRRDWGGIRNATTATWSTFTPQGGDKEGETVAAAAPGEEASIPAAPASESIAAATPPTPEVTEVIPLSETITSNISEALSTETPEFLNSIVSNDLIINTGTLELASLATSWGAHPIMRLQSLFLNLHESFPLMSTGLPWYILIPTVTICLRVLLFGFQVRAQSNAARMAIIQPQMLAGMEKLKAAKGRKDAMGAQAAQMETQELMQKHNVNPIRNLAFPLAQATVFMTMFFAIKGLASAGIPSFETEGLWWVQDLAKADPYWALPIASTALTLATLELGVDSTTQVQTSTTKNMKLFFRAMLVVALPFIAYFPAGVLLYWVTNNSVSLLQSLLLKQALVRKFFNIPTIPPKIQPGEPGYVPEPSFSEAFKNVQIGAMEKWDEQTEAAAKKAEQINKAKAARESIGVIKKPEVYLPRAPLRKRVGRVEEVGRDLLKGESAGMFEAEVTTNATSVIYASPVIVQTRTMGKEEERARRTLAAKQKRKKSY